MYGVGISLLLGWFFASIIPQRFAKNVNAVLPTLTYSAFAFSAICSVLYLFYPNFIDHLEPTITQITLIWMQGGNLYPPTDVSSMHGLLYGPALYWIQRPFLALGSDPILSSKLPSVIAFNLAWGLLFSLYKQALSKAYLLLLLPFNLILFWNRAEPYFVLLVGLAVLVVEQRPSAGVLLLGILAGLASSLKAHGILYILPFFIFWGAYSVRSAFEFVFAFGVTCLSFFLNDTTSLIQYVAYLKLAANHGISLAYLERNLFFLLLTWIPLGLAFQTVRISRSDSYQWLCVVLIEVLIAIAGSKPGAGVHHLIPVIILNSYLYEIQLRKTLDVGTKYSGVKFGFVILAIYVLFAVWKNVYDSEIKSLDVIATQTDAKNEIQQLGASHPNLLMGVTDKENDHYRLSFLRTYLITPESPQFEYAGYMDLNYSGVSDQALSESLQQCRYKYIAMPLQGEPFSIENFYTNEPLFSDATRTSFHQHYEATGHGKFFILYTCH
jgi:hypothetical protein